MIADLLNLVDRWAALLETAVLVWGVRRMWRALPGRPPETAVEWEVAA